jgi:hypothetical protein
MPLTMLTVARIPIECWECGSVRLYRVHDLITDEEIGCTQCLKPLDLSTDQWEAAIKETAEYYNAIILD